MATGAQFCIINESDGNQTSDEKWASIIDGMHTYKPEEIKTHLENAGFGNIQVTVDEKNHWLMATAKKM